MRRPGSLLLAALVALGLVAGAGRSSVAATDAAVTAAESDGSVAGAIRSAIRAGQRRAAGRASAGSGAVPEGASGENRTVADRAVRARFDELAERLLAERPFAERPFADRPFAERAPAAMRRDEVRRRLQLAEPGTYIGEILLDRDSALTRWPERTRRPLRVWIDAAAEQPGWDAGYRDQVRAAFASWEEVGIPVRFDFVADARDADVQVTWVDRFVEPISGKTIWSRDDRWWIVDADIQLALHHRNGDPLDASQVRAIALHEVGHLLGLDHTEDPANIMAARVRVRELSPADQATVRLLYSVPAGRIR